MSWGLVAAAAITVVGGAVSANQANKGANKAATAQERAAQLSVDEDRRQFDIADANQRPFLDAGYDALTRQQAALNGDFSGFENSPDYLYARQQMVQGMDRSAAAHGRLMAGGYGVDMATNLNGLASQNFGNYWNRLAGRAGQGQTSAQNLGTMGMNMANSIGNAYTNAGNARASAFQQIGQNNADMWAGVANQGNKLAGAYFARNGG